MVRALSHALPAAAQPQEELEQNFTESQADMIENAEDYQVEFATVEIIEKDQKLVCLLTRLRNPGNHAMMDLQLNRIQDGGGTTV